MQIIIKTTLTISLLTHFNLFGQLHEMYNFGSVGSIPSILIGDVTNDGINELVALSNSAVIVFQYNSATETFDPIWVKSDISLTATGFIGDTDNDSENELIIRDTQYNSATIAIYEHQDSTWVESWSTTGNSQADPWHTWVGDSDNDGLNEIIFGYGYGYRGIKIYEHDGSGGYTNVWSQSLGKDVYTVQVVDTDNDGLNELLVGNGFWSSDVRIYEYNESTGTYDNSWNYTYGSGELFMAACGDIDNDSENEILSTIVPAYGSHNDVKIFEHNTGDNYSEFWSLGGTTEARYPIIDNVFNNGLNQFIFSTKDSTIQIYENNGTDYDQIQTISVNYYIKDMRVGDVFNNGTNVLLVSGSDSTIHFYGTTFNNTGLVAHYPFNGNANDESENGNDGTVNGGVDFTSTDRFGNTNSAATFNGSDGYITTGISIDDYPELTLSVWMKSDNAGIHDAMIYARDDIYGSGLMLNNPASQVRFDCYTDSGGGVSFATDYNYLDDQWHHVIGVYNGVETKLYIDNELKDSDSTLGLINIIDELKIGWDDCPTCSPSRYWTGELDDILVYNRTLTTQEIDSLYHLNGWGTGLVAYYPFNGNADDESGNGNNGTVNGATLTTDRFGNVNSAYSFDGIDDYIVINSSDILESSDSITVNAFFKPGISNSTVGGRIINKDDQYAGDPDRSYYLRVDDLGNSNYKFVWNVYNVQLTAFHADYEASLDTSQWYHIAGSYDGTHQKLYFNGQLVADSTVNLARQKGNAPIYFGRPNYGAYIAEYIDDVGIYNRALSDAEIDSLYHLGGWGTQLVSDTLFFDDFSGDLSQWTEYNGGGSYNIQIVGSDGNPAPSLLADDYASWGCSAISNEVFSYSNGLSVSADHKNAAPTSQRYTFMALTTVPVGDYTNIVRVSLNYGNTALHCALRYDSAGVEYDESVLQPVPTVEGWQNCRFEIRSDHYVEFFYNDSLVYTSQHQITQQYDGQVKVRIGHRKSYYDNVLVMSVQETQNMYTVSLGNTEVSHPDTSSVPVNIVGAQGVNINSFELTLNKGSGEILFMGVDTNSTLIGDAGWMYALNETDTTILFAAAGSNEITMDGTLLNLRYAPMGDPCITVPIEIRSCIVNTGSDSLTLENGSVTILPVPNYGDVDENGMIQAFDAAVLLEHIVGEDTLVCQGLANAEVSLNDTLTALDASLILQYRVDSIDSLPYSGDLLLASGDIHLLDEVYTVADTQVAVPIIGNMCEDIYSMEGTVLFDSTQMSFSEMVLYELANNAIRTRVDGNRVEFAYCSAEPLDVDGTLGLVIFNTGIGFQGSDVVITSMRINENLYFENLATSVFAGINDNKLIPTSYALHPNYPNPFNPTTQLRYDLPEQAHVSIVIYNLLGRQITQLINRVEEPGYHSAVWNGTDQFGKEVSAGVYLYQIKAGEFIQTRKMVLLK